MCAAPKGNLFALGNTGGRPPYYKNKDELMKKIAEYIEYEDSLKGYDTMGNSKAVYTIEGCALYLGFATMKSFYDYEKKDDEFLYVISRYRLFLTQWNAKKLYWGGTFAGAMFWLKNHGGYTDETVQNMKGDISRVVIEEKKREGE